jgi:hypothetical protein
LKKWILLIALLAAALSQAQAQGGRGFWHQEWTVEKGDSIPLVHVLPVYVFSRPVDLRRYRRLVDAVKKVYPIAQIAKAKMATMEEELCRLPTKKAQKEYIKQIYHEIKDEYTPVLKHMTRTQGRVLLKLIDRETEYTAYEVLKEFRGGFVAGFWQRQTATPQARKSQGVCRVVSYTAFQKRGCWMPRCSYKRALVIHCTS